MPLIAESTFQPARGLGNGHLQTVWPVVFRRVPLITKERERLELPDGDFLDLDWARSDVRKRLVVLTHGLESSSNDTSIQGMAAVFLNAGWNVLAWNMRGCSGEPNRLLRFYHSGATEDLAAVLDHVADSYETIALMGFSLGGNIVLKYLGETVNPRIARAAAFSVPCDLTTSVDVLDGPANSIYTRRFIRTLRAKIEEKQRMFPGCLDVSHLQKIRTFHAFDAAYTAPLHGFSSAEDYWEKSSSRRVLAQISTPTLLVNARNDPFLSPACFPTEIADESEHFHLECPASGGHGGFVSSLTEAVTWDESRALEFIGK